MQKLISLYKNDDMFARYKQRYNNANMKYVNETYAYSNLQNFLIAHLHQKKYRYSDCVYNDKYYRKDFDCLFDEKQKEIIKNHRIFFLRFKSLDTFLNLNSFDDFCYKAQFILMKLDEDFIFRYIDKNFVLRLLGYDDDTFEITALHIRKNEVKKFSLFDMVLYSNFLTIRLLNINENRYFPFNFLDYDYLQKAYKAYKNHYFLRAIND